MRACILRKKCELRLELHEGVGLLGNICFIHNLSSICCTFRNRRLMIFLIIVYYRDDMENQSLFFNSLKQLTIYLSLLIYILEK